MLGLFDLSLLGLFDLSLRDLLVYANTRLLVYLATKSVIYLSSRCTNINKVVKRVFKTHKVGVALCWKFKDYTGNKHKGLGLRKFTKKVKMILRGPKSGPFANSSVFM